MAPSLGRCPGAGLGHGFSSSQNGLVALVCEILLKCIQLGLKCRKVIGSIHSQQLAQLYGVPDGEYSAFAAICTLSANIP